MDALIGDKKTITYEDVMNMEYATMLMKVFLSHSWSNTFASVMNMILRITFSFMCCEILYEIPFTGDASFVSSSGSDL